LEKAIEAEFLDIINSAICQAIHDYLGQEAPNFFRKVGKYHLEEAIRRNRVTITSGEDPLDVLVRIARYLESFGYMERILINKLSESEAFVEMFGVSVTNSSVKMLKEGKEPSHYMTNVMMAALQKLGVRAELEDVSFDERKSHFKEHWKILGPS